LGGQGGEVWRRKGRNLKPVSRLVVMIHSVEEEKKRLCHA
jgi:hypothetical protein